MLVVNEDKLVERANEAYISREFKLRDKYIKLIKIRIEIRNEDLAQLKEVLADTYTEEQISNIENTLIDLEKECSKFKLSGNEKAVRHIKSKIDQLQWAVKLQNELDVMNECVNQDVQFPTKNVGGKRKRDEISSLNSSFDINYQMEHKRIKKDDDENPLNITFGPSSKIDPY